MERKKERYPWGIGQKLILTKHLTIILSFKEGWVPQLLHIWVKSSNHRRHKAPLAQIMIIRSLKKFQTFYGRN